MPIEIQGLYFQQVCVAVTVEFPLQILYVR